MLTLSELHQKPFTAYLIQKAAGRGLLKLSLFHQKLKFSAIRHGATVVIQPALLFSGLCSLNFRKDELQTGTVRAGGGWKRRHEPTILRISATATTTGVPATIRLTLATSGFVSLS